MRLPRLRLPRPQFSLDWLGALVDRRTILYAGYTAALFVLFLFVTFPHELVVRRALRGVNRGPVSVDFSSVNFAWLNGYELNSFHVAPAEADGQPPYFECAHVWVRPALGALLRGKPYDFLLGADLYGGVADGEIITDAGAVAATVKWKDLNLGRYRALTALLEEGQLAGRVSGFLNFEGRAPNLTAGQSTGEFTVEGAALTGAKVSGFTVPDLRLRQTKAKFAVREGRLEIQEFQATGDVDLQASGNILLHDPPQESVLNLRVTIQQGLTTPDAVKTLIALIPRPPGSKPDAPIMITGTLERPHVR
jgi:type II secretion system protein N